MKFLILFFGGVVIALATVRSFRVAFSLPPPRQLVVPVRPWAFRVPVSHAHEGWLAIKVWEQMMDSLRRDSGGRHKYDSILMARPGIMDSARTAEQFFYLHDR